MAPILIPVIRQITPEILAEEICSVQPMSESAGSIYGLKASQFSMKIETDVIQFKNPPKQGDTRHVFGRGWERYYGTEWISTETWLWKIKIHGL